MDTPAFFYTIISLQAWSLHQFIKDTRLITGSWLPVWKLIVQFIFYPLDLGLLVWLVHCFNFRQSKRELLTSCHTTCYGSPGSIQFQFSQHHLDDHLLAQKWKSRTSSCLSIWPSYKEGWSGLQLVSSVVDISSPPSFFNSTCIQCTHQNFGHHKLPVPGGLRVTEVSNGAGFTINSCKTSLK